MSNERKYSGSNLFDSLKGESEQKDEEFKLEEENDHGLETIIQGFRILVGQNGRSIKGFMEEYDRCLFAVPSDYTAIDIGKFSVAIEKYENFHQYKLYFGMYVSALINASKEKSFKIFTSRHDLGSLNSLGFMNCGKELTIKGDAGFGAGHSMMKGRIKIKGIGNYIGYEMCGGEIFVYGNGGCYIGDEMNGGTITVLGDAGLGIGKGMKGGNIIIKGDTDIQLGLHMKGGYIFVSGNVKGRVGCDIYGGEIHIDGEKFDLSKRIYGGNIYHKGKQIVKDGKKVR